MKRKYIYLWTEAEYSRHVPSNPETCGGFEVCLDTLNTTHENELEVITWAKADGFNAEIGDGCVRIWKD